MKELYVIWGVIVCFIMISANSKGSHLFSFSTSGGGGTYYGSGSFGRGWDWGSGGGFHK